METMKIVSGSCDVSGPDKPQAPKDKAVKGASLTPGSGAQENGVRVSVTRPEVEAEVSIKRIFGEGSEDVSFAYKEEVVSCPVTRESGREGLDSALGVNDTENNVDGGKAPKDGSLGLSGDAASSGKVVDCRDNGISLVVEVHGSSPTKEGHSSKADAKRGQNLGKESSYGDNDGSLRGNEGNPSEKLKEMDGSKPNLLRHKNGEADEDMGNGEYQYSVGDFVWGKIKSHPWWPGQIYDPKDASEDAAKHSQKDRLLVAYFGDDTYAWCHPHKLKPFEENFAELSKQSNSRIFVKAVVEAVAEIGRRVELKMTCPCTPKEIKNGLSRSLTVNAGVKEETVVPQGGIGKFSAAHFQPAKFLSGLKCIAQDVSVSSLLECSVLKSQLSAFCRSKGPYHELAVFHEPREISGLEEKVASGVTKSSDLGAPVEVPIQGPFEEDWLSMPMSPSLGRNIRSSVHKASGSEDKLYQRRKQKSIAEIMGGSSDAEAKIEEADMSKEDPDPDKLATTSVKQRRKRRGSEAESDAVNNNLTSPQWKRKKSKLSGSPLSSEDRAASVESDGEGKGGESESSAVSRGRKKKGLRVEIDGSKIPEESGQPSRERKKSKYLCPPYTNVIRMNKNSGTMGDPKTESHEVSNLGGKGERTPRAAGQSIGSPTILKCSGDMPFQNNDDSKELQSPKQNRRKAADQKGISMSLQDVLDGLRLLALSPFYLRENKSRDKIGGFLSAFRSAVYHEGSDYGVFDKHGPSLKRKHQESEPAEDLKRNDQDSCKQARRNGKKNETTVDTDGPELKRAASDTKTKHRGNDKKVESAATLFLSFGPGVSLPLKDDLVKMFSRFGTLNESETEILYDSFCARVVFSRSSDAEEAFNSSQRASPFGAGAKVTYRLRYLSPDATTITRKAPEKKKHGSGGDGSKKKARNGGPSAVVESSAGGGGGGGEKSQLNFIKEKLEMMTNMLEQSGGKMSGEMKSSLEGEMKGLLKKVSTMAQTPSPSS